MKFTPPRIVHTALFIVGIVFAASVESIFNEYILSIINFIGIFIILSVSLNFTNGFTGLFSLGHPGFMAIGGYVTAILTFPVSKKAMFLEIPQWLSGLEMPFFPALLIGGACAALIAVLVGIPVLRLRGHYLAVATMGFLIIVQVLIINMESVTRGPLGLNGLPPLTTTGWVFAWVVITVYATWKIKFSSYGQSMIAVREDALAAECLGIDLFRTRVSALATGAFFAGIAGGLWAHLVTAITPSSFSLVLAFQIVVMVVVGGSGSITGSVAGAVIFSVLIEIFRPLEENYDIYGIGEVLMALILIVILIYRPIGIFGNREPDVLTSEEFK